MKILVVGGGGREHALVWKLAQSPQVTQIFCAPGNGGISDQATVAPVKADDLAGLIRLATEQAVDLTVVGPEAPLVAGIVDHFQEAHLPIFGPTRALAQLEGSKSYAKQLFMRYHIPTAPFQICDTPEAARTYLKAHGAPIVIKADGLAQGKGVTVAETMEEAEDAVERMMVKQVFGAAGTRVVMEERLRGEEASIMVIADGQTVIPFAPSQDHKRLLDGDAGPNTGGMGAYSPTPVVNAQMSERVMAQIVSPLIQGLKQDGLSYCGVLYLGLMVTEQGPQVLECNVRFGDPELQAVLPRMQGDLAELLWAAATGSLRADAVRWDDRACVAVVVASRGYPGEPHVDCAISGVDQVKQLPEIIVFHAGTQWGTVNGQSQLVTAGGRVLAVAALGRGIEPAMDRAYHAIREIHFEGMQYRKDIGRRGVWTNRSLPL